MRILIVILIIISSSSCLVLNAQTSENDWNYPIVPGTNEWVKLKNYQEKIEICQIPDSILYSLSTKKLFELIKKHPLLINIFVYNNIEDGVNTFKKNFNGINELLKREEFPSVLLNEYSNIDPLAYNDNWPSVKKGGLSFSIKVLEILIAQDEVIEKLNKDQKKKVVNILKLKKEKKLNGNIYGYHSIMSTYYAASKIILSENTSSTVNLDGQFDELQKFSENGDLKNPKLVPALENLITNYLKQ